MICLLFSGMSLNLQQQIEYETDLNKIDYKQLEESFFEFQSANQLYYQSKGWFSCDELCTRRKLVMEKAKEKYDYEVNQQNMLMSNAKGKVGVFSSVGVDETRQMVVLFYSKCTISCAFFLKNFI